MKDKIEEWTNLGLILISLFLLNLCHSYSFTLSVDVIYNITACITIWEYFLHWKPVPNRPHSSDNPVYKLQSRSR